MRDSEREYGDRVRAILKAQPMSALSGEDVNSDHDGGGKEKVNIQKVGNAEVCVKDSD